MFANRFRYLLITALFACPLAGAFASDDAWFHEKDPLAPRDEWGVFHQTARVIPPDYYPRWGARYYYWFKSGHELLQDPAYVAALQITLRQYGYYCGPIDGVMTQSVHNAIARMQKNYVQRVNGELTVAVRRELHLP
jgi:hypothetical protein